MRPRGRKADFDWRLGTADRAVRAGARAIGIGALLGLSDWRLDALFTALHLDHLRARHWRTRFAVSFPRIRPQEGDYRPESPVATRELAQLICAFRLFDPDLDLVLSTREPATLRDRADKAVRSRGATVSWWVACRTPPGRSSPNVTSLAEPPVVRWFFT